MSLRVAMLDACRAVGIKPPTRAVPGRWVRSDTLESNGKGDAAIMVNPDQRSGVVWNHQTGQHERFWIGKDAAEPAPRRERDLAAERRAEAERIEVERACHRIVDACERAQHPYLARKGFPTELGLVIEDARPFMPAGRMGEAMIAALPEADGPLLIVPGRIAGRLSTVQFIASSGDKKNIRGGQMGGAAHRLATGRETWVCEGIATALSVRAALRILGRSATVLSAFSASNVAKVASGIRGSIIAADHDKPLEQFGGIGAGEFYARKAGGRWLMPSAPGDFNDMHEADGLRAVAMHLRKVVPP